MVFHLELDKQFHRTWDIIDDLDVIIEDCLDGHTKEQLTTLRNFYQARFLRLYQTVCRSTQFEPTDGVCHGSGTSNETLSFNAVDLDLLSNINTKKR